MGAMRAEDILIRKLAANAASLRPEQLATDTPPAAIDWEYVLHASQREGVASLIYEVCRRSGSGPAAGSSVREAFEAVYYTTAAKNAETCRQAAGILSLFTSHGIGTILLKGVFLAEYVYHNLALRPTTDLDILIRREDLSKAHGLLAGLGYTPPRSHRDFLENRTSCSVNSLLYGPPGATGVPVHLHWHIINSTWPIESLAGKIDMEYLWTSSRTIDMGGAATRAFSACHTVIYMCHHAVNHFFDRLILACDIARALKECDGVSAPEEMMHEADRLGLGWIVSYALVAVADLLDIKIPEADMSHRVPGLLRKRYRGLPLKGRGSYITSYLAYLLNEEGVLRKVRYLWRTVVPPQSVVAHNRSLTAPDVSAADYWKRAFGK